MVHKPSPPPSPPPAGTSEGLDAVQFGKIRCCVVEAQPPAKWTAGSPCGDHYRGTTGASAQLCQRL